MSRNRPLPQLVVRPHDPRRARAVTVFLAALWVASMALAAWLTAYWVAPEFARTRDMLTQSDEAATSAEKQLETARQRLAVVERSEQVSRTAAETLQQTLREREEELIALRADLAFYQRLVGGGSARRGLTAHELEVKPIADTGGYAFRLTLLQNLRKGAVTEGTALLSIEGVQDTRLTTLDWAALTQQAQATPLRFNFKYFQRLRGSVMLPRGFAPNRIKVVVKSTGGEQAERTFDWKEALSAGEKSDVRK
jgi:hypothetical protein